MGKSLTVAPGVEPVSLQEIKTHLRIDLAFTEDDTYLESLIKASREMAESYTRRGFIEQTWQWKLDRFPTVSPDLALVVPVAPVLSIESINYIDCDGVEQTLDPSNYVLDDFSTPAKINLAWDKTWPTPRSQANAVTVEFKAGFGTAAADVPEPIRHAIKMIAGHLYENREDVAPVTMHEIPQSSKWALDPYRVWGL